MNRLRQLWGDFDAYLQKLSQRERWMLGSAVGGLVLMVLVLTSLGFSSAIHRRQLAVDNKAKALGEIGLLASTYNERARARSQLEQRLRVPVRLFTFIDDVSKKQGIEIGDMQDRGNVVGSDKITESIVEFDLSKLTLDRLTAFLNAIEHDPHLIKVKKIRIRNRIDDPNSVDASLTVASYSMGST